MSFRRKDLSNIMLLAFLTLSLLPLVSRTQASLSIMPGPHAKLMFDDADFNNDGFLQRAENRIVFNRFDSNGDGRVSRVEYVSQMLVKTGSSALGHFLFNLYDVDYDQMLDAHDYEYFYRQMDLNRGGLVSKAEFISFWTMVLRYVQHFIHQKSPQGPPVLQPGPHSKLMFNHADTNKDGFLQRAEMWVTFNRYDNNGDGRVSRVEYVKYQERLVPDITALANYLFNIYDLDFDDMLDAHDYEYFYRQMDLNRDGRVGKAEFIFFWTALLESVKHLIPRKH